MTSTATTQGVKCGNHPRDERVYHATSADVRDCYGQRNVRPITPVSAPPAQAQPTNADEARTAAMQRLANQTSPFSTTATYPASPRQIDFYTDLVNEVFDGEAKDRALAMVGTLSSTRIKVMISNMLEMRTSQRAMKASTPTPSSQPTGTWKADMIEKVMGTWSEGNFAIEEQGKTRFYRISRRGKNSRRPGTWKIQERVSDSLFPRSDGLLSKVCPEIMAMGVKASALMFFERMHMCSKCGRSLTDDTGNPYYAMGLGPECGGK